MEFVEEPNFTKAIQRFPDSDYAAFQSDMQAQPEQGDLLRGTGGFRKARMGFPSAGIGKSGGARVIYLYVPEQETIYLVMIYGKSQKKALTGEEENALRKAADQIRNSRRA
ncbi:MAG: type II toxin-antitoxin system RelE/ParE family toxin [Terrimicrobiaceae bacterium]|nr:type II toxin-antitoxin system RelE/ParE family toxin [Terrimicrobiaceae bacterium]